MPQVELPNYDHLYGVLRSSTETLSLARMDLDRASAIADEIAGGPVTAKDMKTA